MGLAAGWDGRDGGGASAGSREEGTEEGGMGDPAHGAWELPARLYLHFLSQALGALGGLSKTHVFQDIPPKENCSTLSGLGCVKLRVWKSLFQGLISHYRFKGKYKFKTFKEI